MPSCGSQIILCEVPIRFDTYKGCTHNCKYCFTYRKYNIVNIEKGETAKALLNFIKGERTQETKWCDWNIPIHWGGLADPFQPCEKEHRLSFECLKVLAETKYPVIVSTKGVIPAEPEYLDLISQCNMIFQVSLVSPQLNEIETGAPTFEERIEMIRKVSPKVKRVIIRCQPYVREVLVDVIKQIKLYKEIGVYGVVAEGMKFFKKREGMVRNGADFCYPRRQLEQDFRMIKEACHANGLKFYCGENRLRAMGDSLCCCGVNEGDNIFDNPNFQNIHPNKGNLGRKIYDEENYKFTEGQNQPGSTYPFKTIHQTSSVLKLLTKEATFSSLMDACSKDKGYMGNFLSKE